MFRRSCAVALAVGMCFFATVPAAHADVDVTIDKARVAPAKSGAKSANVIVASTVTQEEYADISYDVTLTGFTAKRTFAYRDGACPKKLVQYTGPGTVFQCGWVQQGKDAVLNISILGTFPSSTVRVKINRKAVVTPKKAGDYAVSVSSWAFSTVTTSITIK